MTIIVGVDGSPVSREALAWALAEARLRASAVRAVYAWDVLPEGGTGRMLGTPVDETVAGDLTRLADGAQRRLAEAVAAVAGAETVELETAQGHAAEVLVERAHGAELLVVGSRGHGTLAGALLGSVSHACAHHASCPVVIVRGVHEATPAWSPAGVIARELAQNASTWEALERLGVREGDELALEFVYESAGPAGDRDLAAYLAAAGYEVSVEEGGVTGRTPRLPVGPRALEAWLRMMVQAGYEHGGCVFDGWTATVSAGR